MLIIDQEETMWRQRSRVSWLNNGDANTAYFHKVVNGRRRNNMVNHIAVEGVEIYDQKTNLQKFSSYYKDLFGSSQNSVSVGTGPAHSVSYG